MKNMASVNVIKNDFGFDFSFTVTDSNDNVVDLSASNVAFRLGKPGETPLISGACTGMSVSGTCAYSVQDGDLSTEGIYKGELEITTGSQKLTVGNIEVRVGDELG